MATEYISREAAIEIICGPCAFKVACNLGVEPRCKYYIRMTQIPAADVRPVVRCKDCKYYTDGKLLGPTKFCYFYKIGTGLNTADDDFCSKGERSV